MAERCVEMASRHNAQIMVEFVRKAFPQYRGTTLRGDTLLCIPGEQADYFVTDMNTLEAAVQDFKIAHQQAMRR